MTNSEQIQDFPSNEVFCVEECEPGIFQSVFPSRIAHKSSLHTSRADAWDHINEIRDSEIGDDHPARMSSAVRGAL